MIVSPLVYFPIVNYAYTTRTSGIPWTIRPKMQFGVALNHQYAYHQQLRKFCVLSILCVGSSYFFASRNTDHIYRDEKLRDHKHKTAF